MGNSVQEIRARFNPQPVVASKRTAYSATKYTPTTADWVTSQLSADAAILQNYERLRDRSRDIMRNNPYGKGWRRLLLNNVIGSRPIKLENEASRISNGESVPIVEHNTAIEEAWKDWQKVQTATVTRSMHYYDVCKTVLGNVNDDGYCFVRKVPGFDNEFLFSLQVIPADHLDHNYHENPTRNGNRIQGGIEFNGWGEPVAYYFFQSNPNDFTTATRYGPRQRVPASQIIHVYLAERAEQTNGAPWAATALINLRHLGGYQEAAVVDARAGAMKMGVWQEKGGDFHGAANIEDGEDDEDPVWGGNTQHLEPGTIIEAPDGKEFVSHDPNNPNNTIGEFNKAILRGICAGLGANYNKLASDFESTSFSSARMANEPEHDHWRSLQFWWVEHFEREVFDAWYPMAVLSGKLNLPPTRIEALKKPKWTPRGWQSPDPLKEAQANKLNVEEGFDSRTKITARKGQDFAENINELAKEEALAAEKGVTLGEPEPAPQPAQTQPDDNGEQQGGGDNGSGDPGRSKALSALRDARERHDRLLAARDR